MPRRHRCHGAEFKRQVVAEYHGGETLHALSRRHDLSRNLIRIRVEKVEAGALDEDDAAADLLTAYEARMAALGRLVGRHAPEIEFPKGGARSGPSRRSAPASVTGGPAASPSGGDGLLMGVARSSFYAEPSGKPRDAEIVAQIRATTDVFEGYGHRRVDAERRHRGCVVKASPQPSDIGRGRFMPRPRAPPGTLRGAAILRHRCFRSDARERRQRVRHVEAREFAFGLRQPYPNIAKPEVGGAADRDQARRDADALPSPQTDPVQRASRPSENGHLDEDAGEPGAAWDRFERRRRLSTRRLQPCLKSKKAEIPEGDAPLRTCPHLGRGAAMGRPKRPMARNFAVTARSDGVSMQARGGRNRKRIGPQRSDPPGVEANAPVTPP